MSQGSSRGDAPTSWTHSSSRAPPFPGYPLHPPASHVPDDFNRWLVQNNPVHQSNIVPGTARISDIQLSVAHGYALHRGNGVFTRLILADEIDVIDRSQLRPTQSGPQGLIILPHTRGVTPEERRHTGENYILPVDVRTYPFFPFTVTNIHRWSTRSFSKMSVQETTTVAIALGHIFLERLGSHK